MDGADGGYDASFIVEVADYLKCVVCRLALRNALLLVGCGHRLCNGCFERLKEHAAEENMELLCPHDRIKVDASQVVEDKGITRAVLDLKAKCSNYEEGCQWNGELRNLQIHLERDCVVAERKNTQKLLTQLTTRLERCEVRLNEKDKQIQALEKKLTKTQEDLHQLRNEKIITQVNNKRSEGLDSDRNDPSFQDLTIAKISEQMNSLQKRIMNVKEYIPDERTVFVWKLENYSHYQEIREEVHSPRFYSHLDGHCCQIHVAWFGLDNDRLGVYLYICKGIYEEVSATNFSMGITFETSCNIYGEKRCLEFSCNEVQENYDAFTIDPSKDKSSGYGKGLFFDISSVRSYIVDDSLTIKCTLWHSPQIFPLQL